MTAKAKAKKATIMTLDAPVIAPPSPAAVVAGANTQLPAGLAQAEADLATLQALLDAWPADAPASLQPVVEVLVRIIESLVLLAQASAGMAAQSGLL